MNENSSKFWVYILENSGGNFYIGSTGDLAARVSEHNDSERDRTHYTAKHGPWQLVWSEAHATRSSAMQREREIKRKKSSNWIRVNLLNRSPH